jgi:hypothetical protein
MWLYTGSGLGPFSLELFVKNPPILPIFWFENGHTTPGYYLFPFLRELGREK